MVIVDLTHHYYFHDKAPLGSFENKKLNFEKLFTPGVNVIKLFPSSLTTRSNKLESMSLEILSSQVLEFESKARANPIGATFRYFHFR